jgi:hypothetical protein
VCLASRPDVARISGPARVAHNYLHGGLHGGDAARFGFPAGGAVSAHAHLDRFPGLLVEGLGTTWVERGWLSLYFDRAVGDGRRVRVDAEMSAPDAAEVSLRDVDDDDAILASGDAGLGASVASELRTRDLRLCDPAELRGFGGLSAGHVLADAERVVPASPQIARIDAGEIDDPLPSWTSLDEWGAVVACPSTIVSLLFDGEGHSPVAAWTRRAQPDAATMFGAIELAVHDGPVLLGRAYRVVSTVVGVGRSPRRSTADGTAR